MITVTDIATWERLAYVDLLKIITKYIITNEVKPQR